MAEGEVGLTPFIEPKKLEEIRQKAIEEVVEVYQKTNIVPEQQIPHFKENLAREWGGMQLLGRKDIKKRRTGVVGKLYICYVPEDNSRFLLNQESTLYPPGRYILIATDTEGNTIGTTQITITQDFENLPAKHYFLGEENAGISLKAALQNHSSQIDFFKKQHPNIADKTISSENSIKELLDQLTQGNFSHFIEVGRATWQGVLPDNENRQKRLAPYIIALKRQTYALISEWQNTLPSEKQGLICITGRRVTKDCKTKETANNVFKNFLDLLRKTTPLNNAFAILIPPGVPANNEIGNLYKEYFKDGAVALMTIVNGKRE